MIIFILLQVFSLWACLKIMKSKMMYARDRWIWSIAIFTIPLLGIFIYQVFRNTIPMKEYRFFSERFIDKYLS